MLRFFSQEVQIITFLIAGTDFSTHSWTILGQNGVRDTLFYHAMEAFLRLQGNANARKKSQLTTLQPHFVGFTQAPRACA